MPSSQNSKGWTWSFAKNRQAVPEKLPVISKIIVERYYILSALYCVGFRLRPLIARISVEAFPGLPPYGHYLVFFISSDYQFGVQFRSPGSLQFSQSAAKSLKSTKSTSPSGSKSAFSQSSSPAQSVCSQCPAIISTSRRST